MSQHTARHDSHARPRDEDIDDPGTRQPEHKQSGQPRRPAGGLDEPEEDEFELIGDDDLGAADLGPLGPHADPDSDSGRPRKIAR